MPNPESETKWFICAYVSEYCKSTGVCVYAREKPEDWFMGTSVKPGETRGCDIKNFRVPLIQYYDNMAIPEGDHYFNWVKSKGVDIDVSRY